MRKQYWFLLVLVAIGLIVLSVMGIKHLRARGAENAVVELSREDLLSADEAPRPELTDEYGDPAPADPGAVGRYMLSEEYADLSNAERREFQDQVVAANSDPAMVMEGPPMEGPPTERSDLTETQREYLRQEAEPMMRRIEENRLANFFSLSESEQNAIIDAHIDRMEARRAEWERRGGSDRGGRGGSRDTATSYPTRFLRHWSRRSPQTRSYMQELHRRMQARMEARGVEPFGRH